MTLTFEHDLDSVKMSPLAKHLGQRSFSAQLFSRHTDTRNGSIALPGPLKQSITTTATSDVTIAAVAGVNAVMFYSNNLFPGSLRFCPNPNVPAIPFLKPFLPRRHVGHRHH